MCAVLLLNQVVLATLLKTHSVALPVGFEQPRQRFGLGMTADAIRVCLTPL
jgi:hypothetical protein